MSIPALPLDRLRTRFGAAMQENVSLAPYTSARVGGHADALLILRSVDALVDAVTYLREQGVDFILLGGGSNVLVSDLGIRQVVLLNKAGSVHFETSGDFPRVRADAGSGFSQLARRAAARGLSGLEWAATVPGTVGGAVYGNAGAFGGDVARSLVRASLLTEGGRETWPVERFAYGYRTSLLKRGERQAVILDAEFALRPASREQVSATIEGFSARRKETQPPGASMGSMFKNPAGDYAGRLIEAAGLKGARIGNAEISTVHANFFISRGPTRSADIRALIELARSTVAQKFGVELELEIELIGDWQPA